MKYKFKHYRNLFHENTRKCKLEGISKELTLCEELELRLKETK